MQSTLMQPVAGSACRAHMGGTASHVSHRGLVHSPVRSALRPARPRSWARGSVVCSAGSAPTEEDKLYMRRALELAKTATGKTYPNPLVGCVIVKDGKVIGEGYHPKAGEPHAEVFALRAAGAEAEGATAYVSLEPCNHFGRTPPCSRALVAAKVKKVVVGFIDPDPRVSGGGIKTLTDAGIEVVVGCESEASREINEEFLSRLASEAAAAAKK